MVSFLEVPSTKVSLLRLVTFRSLSVPMIFKLFEPLTLKVSSSFTVKIVMSLLLFSDVYVPPPMLSVEFASEM